MMRRPHIMALLAAVALSAACLHVAHAQPAGLRDVRDPGGRFSISVPADWEVQTNAGGSPSVIAAAPAMAGEFRVNVHVVVTALRGPLSPEAFGRGHEASLRTIFHRYAVVQEGPAQIGGRAAYYRYYTWETNTGVSVYQVQVYFTAGQTAFVVTGSTANDPERLRKDLPLIARVIDSFRLAEASAPTI